MQQEITDEARGKVWIRRKKKTGQEISFSQYLDTPLYMHDCIFLMFSVFGTQPSVLQPLLWLSKSQRCFPAVLPTNTDHLVNWVSCLAQMPEASVVGTPREVPSVPRDQPTPAAALLFKWIYMTCRKPINRRTNTCMCVTCMSAIFVNECLMFVDDRFFSQIELWNHDSKSIALIKTSKSVITVDCFVFRSILTCPRMNHNVTPLTRPYRGVQQMVCGRYLSTVILHNGSVNTSTCLARESGVR